jgi:YVTN family beta-propeller protein
VDSVEFNAWQNQRIGPPWWSLIDAVYKQSRQAISRNRRYILFKLFLWECGWRFMSKHSNFLLLLTLTSAIIGSLILSGIIEPPSLMSDGTSNKKVPVYTRPDQFVTKGEILFGELGTVAFDRDSKRDMIYTLAELHWPDNYTLYMIDSGPEFNDNITLKNAGNITLTQPPSIIAVNDNTKMAYVSNRFSGSVSVIDLYTKKIIANVLVGHGPVGISINPDTNMVYVANENSDDITVIDGFHNKAIANIAVGKSPFKLAFNPLTNIVYVTNRDSNTVSMIDSSINKVIVPGNVSFDIVPSTSGHIKCDNKEYPTKQSFRIAFDALCKAEPNKGFQFSSWTEDLGNNSTKTISASMTTSPFDSLLSTFLTYPRIAVDNASSLNMTRHGNFSANFERVPPPIPPEYWIPLYGIIVSSIVGWSIPSIIGWIKARKNRKESLNEYDNIIKSLSNAPDPENLEGIKNQVVRSYLSEKLNESQYKILDKKISEYYNKITDKKSFQDKSG